MEINATTSQPIPAQQPCAGGQNKAPTTSAHQRLHGEAETAKQLSSSAPRGETQVPRSERRNRQQRMKPHEIYKRNQVALQELFRNNYYKKFFIIRAEEEQNLAEVNVIKANKELEQTLKGKPKNVTELRDGTLLIEVANEQQSINIKNLKKLDNKNVLVVEHASLNQVKGTIHYRNRPGYSDDDILSELKAQKVVTIYNIKRKISGTMEATPIYILTFDACQLPQEVTIGWTKCSVREYIPTPRRCFKCNRFGHGSKTCRQEQSTCVRCGDEEHGAQCDRQPHCSNCGEQHAASAKECFYYKLEKQVVTLQTREKLSYAQAKRRATDNLVRPNELYSTIVQKPANKECKDNTKPPTRPETRQKSSTQPQETSAGQSQIKPALSQPKASTTQSQPSAKSQARTSTSGAMATNAIATVISGRKSAEKSKGDSLKRDGSTLEEVEPSDAARKRGNYSLTAPGRSPSDSFPTPSQAARAKPSRREVSVDRGKQYNQENEKCSGINPMDY